MPQSSLMVWLNQPKIVKEARPAIAKDDDVSTTALAPEPPLPQDGQATVNDENKCSKANHESILGSSLRPLAENVEFRACTKEDMSHLKRLTSLLLPIPYPEKFYKEIVEDPLTNNLTLLAMWHDHPADKGKKNGRLVGAIRCRLLAHAPSTPDSGHQSESPMLYLSTLVLLSPYRSHGIASHLLHVVTRRAIDNHGISSIGAHVWEANTEGLEWYHKRGFHEVSRESRYYLRLKPQGAIVMQRLVGVDDTLT